MRDAVARSGVEVGELREDCGGATRGVERVPSVSSFENRLVEREIAEDLEQK
ncbi:MAG TPA: hypothetical protein VII32_14345 [Thermoanaerobaculia bacterium]